MHNPALATLRDIHLPPPVSWFPPAPGWFVLAILFVLLIIIVSVFMRCWQRKRVLRHYTMKQFNQLQHAHVMSHNNTAFSKLNQLLKQVALTFYPTRNIQALTGDGWLAFLNESGHTKAFTQAPGKQLIEAAYSQKQVADPNALFSLCEQWLRKQL